MAPRAERAQALRKRLISAAILLPLAAAAVWLGSYYWDGLVGIFALAMVWEWTGMCASGRGPQRGVIFGTAPAGLVSMLAVAATVAAAAAGRYQIALLLVVAGAGVLTLMSM
ncbi:MAG TPA: phosphatidate cytidylyltransferase, partial [Dongiaceae bacterium]|nr:phosphatidate cytidylyltransferase [Dongiaceae bacterium]